MKTIKKFAYHKLKNHNESYKNDNNQVCNKRNDLQVIKEKIKKEKRI